MKPTAPGAPTRVLIVDDSASMRAMLRKILDADPMIDVAGTAADAAHARALIKELEPDVLLLDVEMPGLDGIAFLERIMRLRPMPVVMCSALTSRGTDRAIEAMRLGAVECIGKPAGGAQGLVAGAAALRKTVKAAARAAVPAFRAQPPARPQTTPETAARRADRYDPESVIAIGASTGGVEALFALLGALPPAMPPILVVQHMPARFTTHFAQRLDSHCALTVVEASDGEPLRPGTVYIAPGTHAHMELRATGTRRAIHLEVAPLVSGHRPSVDRLFRSCAPLGAHAVGVLLTGMGKDGAAGLLAMREAGAKTFGQSAESCVIYGMPGAARAIGAVSRELPLEALPRAIRRACREPMGVY